MFATHHNGSGTAQSCADTAPAAGASRTRAGKRSSALATIISTVATCSGISPSAASWSSVSLHRPYEQRFCERHEAVCGELYELEGRACACSRVLCACAPCECAYAYVYACVCMRMCVFLRVYPCARGAAEKRGRGRCVVQSHTHLRSSVGPNTMARADDFILFTAASAATRLRCPILRRGEGVRLDTRNRNHANERRS
jgi:hypothetical protein